MNITNAVEEKVEGDLLEAIFNRQKELMFKYHDIEKASGLLQTEDCPVNLDDKRGQARIKDFSWRVVEELGEALDAYSHMDIEHFKEELVDGLHFLTELTILSGMDPFSGIESDKLEHLFYRSSPTAHLPRRVMDFIELIGMMCNCLKNKPWKQSQMLTDKDEFSKRLFSTWCAYINILAYTFKDADEVANVYLKKSQVNKFRQRSNY